MIINGQKAAWEKYKIIDTAMALLWRNQDYKYCLGLPGRKLGL